ncbi:MAG: ATP-binding protein [Syntrophorhabdaceae bacterium]|nr:ATP-binding protein [Syntrophorhabdaceae bacterium]
MNDLPRRILESVNMGIAVFDTYGKLSYINPAAEEILQGSFKSFAGKHYRAIFRGSPGAIRVIRKTFDDGTPVAGFDVELRKTKNTAREGSLQVMLGSSPLIGEEGVTRGLVLYIKPSEILSLMGLEEEDTFGADGMQMLAYGIAHEIKNPLGGILGAAQWILRREGTEEERADGVRLIQREARRINELVEKMLEMGKKPPPPRPFDIAPLLREARQLILSEAHSQGKAVETELRVDPSIPPVSGHPDTVYRALLNILKNAIEAIPQAGAIRMEARMNVNYRLGVGRKRKRSFLEIEITDTGVGMTPEQLIKARLPFYTTKPKGTGLGLAIARQAIERHEGILEIKSHPEEGTTVKISLPVAPSRKSAP